MKNMAVNRDVIKSRVSRYMSYLLRHNPENLQLDRYGFVNLDKVFEKLHERFQINKHLVFEIVEKSDKNRFEIVENKIRALYGHTIPVQIELEEDRVTEVFFHGTTSGAISNILRVGLKPMKRTWVHLSPTIEIAIEVGLRRDRSPVILDINATEARKEGLRFYRATNKVYLCHTVKPKYIKLVE